MKTKLFISHIGFFPKGSKQFLIQFPKSQKFEVINRWEYTTVFEGWLKPFFGGDLGEYCVGDFSPIQDEGTYEIRCGDLVSDVIVIHKKPYEMALRTLYNYFPTQRCGDTYLGWNSPCHLHDAQSSVSGEHVDVTGGWHRSCDLRKWLHGTLPGVFALSQLAEYEGLKAWTENLIPDEIKWGNLYYHKMIESNGRLRDYVSIPNDWDEKEMRTLADEDAPAINFALMIGVQCESALFFKEKDPTYAQICLGKAKALWSYLNSSQMPDRYKGRKFKYHEYLPAIYLKCFRGSSIWIGGLLFAAEYLYQTTGENQYLQAAFKNADSLCALQKEGDVDDQLSNGSFWINEEKKEFDTSDCHNTWALFSLIRIIKMKKEVPNRDLYRATIEKVIKQLILSAKRNPWNLIPAHWYSEDPGGGRPCGDAYYTYFTRFPEVELGNNTAILIKALVLLEAHDIVENSSECISTALHQVEWVLGRNVFNSSTCEGIGYNQQQMLINNDEFVPPVPQIPGAVQTGIGSILGTDSPQLGVEKVTVEYDMPATSTLLWAIKRLLEIL